MSNLVKTDSVNPFALETFEVSQRMAKMLASSDIVPRMYQQNIPNCLIAMNVAHRVGVDVLAVMQSLYIVHGRPAFEAKFVIAAINTSGLFGPLRYEETGQRGTPSWGFRVIAKEKESGEDCVGPFVTMEMAKREGWIDKPGSKWQTIPEMMLRYRAVSFWARLFASQVTMGVRTVEEAEDTPEVIVAGPATIMEATPQSRVEAMTKKIKDKAAEVVSDVPPPQSEDEPKPAPAPPTDNITVEITSSDKLQNELSDAHVVDMAELSKSPLEDLQQLAKDKWGDKWEERLIKSCKQAGYKYGELSTMQISIMSSMIRSMKK